MAEAARSFTRSKGAVVLLSIRMILLFFFFFLTLASVLGGKNGREKWHYTGDGGGFWIVKCVFISSFISNK